MATATISTTPTGSLPDEIIRAAARLSAPQLSQPPTHRRPELRKTQLHRSYQSLIRSSPVILIFQHNNLKVQEWIAIRRELAVALHEADKSLGETSENIAEFIRIQVIQTALFNAALRVVEFYRPPHLATPSSPSGPSASATHAESLLDHGLSRKAWRTAKFSKRTHGLEPLLSGPLALVTFPSVSPEHMAAVLSRLSPSKAFPAPKRRVAPAYSEPAVQAGVAKLMLLGARIDGRVLDDAAARDVAGISGGLDGLRASLVGMLTAAGGMGVARALETHGQSLYFALDGRRGMLEDEAGKDA